MTAVLINNPYNKQLDSDSFLSIFPVGYKLFWNSETPPENGIFAQAQLLSRAEYPELWEYVQKYEKIVTETEYLDENICGCYSSGDGETTFRVPNYAGYKFTGYDEAAHTLGKPLDPALPNIKGQMQIEAALSNQSGCLYPIAGSDGGFNGSGSGNTIMGLNANKSSTIYQDGINTVQTPDIPQNIVIKYKS